MPESGPSVARSGRAIRGYTRGVAVSSGALGRRHLHRDVTLFMHDGSRDLPCRTAGAGRVLVQRVLGPAVAVKHSARAGQVGGPAVARGRRLCIVFRCACAPITRSVGGGGETVRHAVLVDGVVVSLIRPATASTHYVASFGLRNEGPANSRNAQANTLPLPNSGHVRWSSPNIQKVGQFRHQHRPTSPTASSNVWAPISTPTFGRARAMSGPNSGVGLDQVWPKIISLEMHLMCLRKEVKRKVRRTGGRLARCSALG